MTGPEHYKEAEELLADITNDDGSVGFGEGGEAYVAAAMVHATLALAAATALSSRVEDIDDEQRCVDGMDQRDRAAWDKAAGVAS